MINSNNEPYMRKKISPTLLALSAAIALLLSSPMLFFNVLLQPIQASQLPPIAFKTPEPAISFNGSLALTFEAEGLTCPSSCDDGDITSGTFLLNHTDGSGQVDSGTLQRGDATAFINQSSGVTISLNYEGKNGGGYVILASCSTSDTNHISLLVPPDQSSEIFFRGGVECPVGGGEGEAHSAQPASSTPSSSLTAGSSQGTDRGNASSSSSNSTDNNRGSSSSSSSNSKDSDSDRDRDGIPDSSDNCPNHSHHRCFKEGDSSSTTTTSTNQQQQSSSSSSSMTGTTTQDGGSSSDSNNGDDDGDGDGIQDSSDKCPHNSNHRCFKEGGDTSSTRSSSSSSTQQEQQPSSSSGTGNQTG